MSNTALARAESKLQTYRSNAMEQIRKQRSTVRAAVDGAEVLGGAALAGYLDTNFVNGIAGMPISTGTGIALVAAGIGMHQRDMTALGLGMLCGTAYKKGTEFAVSNPLPSVG